MAIFLGSERVKVNIAKTVCSIASKTIHIPILTKTKLISSNGYILKDSNGVYLVTKEVE